MDPVSKLKTFLEAAILRLPQSTPEARNVVYNKARKVVAFSKLAHLAPALETAITDVERDFISGGMLPSSPAAGAAARFSWLTRFPARGRLAIVATTSAVALLVALWSLNARTPGDPDFDRGFQDYSASARGFENIPPWTSYYAAGIDGDLHFVEGNGPVPLYTKQVFKVEPGKSYKVSVRIRVVKDDPTQKGALSAAGLVAYDQNGDPIGNGIAPALYGAMSQRLLAAAQGWTVSEGIFAWDNVDASLLLPPATKTVRLVALLNISSPGAVSQIDYLRFEETGASGLPRKPA